MKRRAALCPNRYITKRPLVVHRHWLAAEQARHDHLALPGVGHRDGDHEVVDCDRLDHAATGLNARQHIGQPRPGAPDRAVVAKGFWW